jgi:regulator of protease activity HflC (stomatin/prohibitin superfamily)
VNENVDGTADGLSSSANLPPMNIVFLDQVDADATATARYLLPTDPTSFLTMAREYRTPQNLLNTALVPAFKETLNATASLMSAEEYYSGGRTEFNNEFSNQLENGIYIVRRHEILKPRIGGPVKGSANVSKGTGQDDFGSDQQTVFIVEKLKDADGIPRRKNQQFTNYGVRVVDSRVTDMQPNKKFVERMQLKQQASADRAIAIEQRIQEEQQKLLVEARGSRVVAERQATWKADQIEKTTIAETARQLVVTEARKQKDKATIDKQTAGILLDKAKIDAQSVVVAAEAKAFEKKALLEADNALQVKLNAWLKAQKYWSDAHARKPVPQTVFGTGGGTDGPLDQRNSVQNFMDLVIMKSAKDLNVDIGIALPGAPATK